MYSRYHCKGCNGLLFTDKDRVFHAPVFVSAFMPNGSQIRIMQGDTSNVALFNNSPKLPNEEMKNVKKTYAAADEAEYKSV